MKKYLITGSYNAEGSKGLLQEGGTGRQEAVSKMLAGMGGKIESFYYSFGEHDLYLIIEMPDEISAAAVALRVNAAGLVKIRTAPLLSIADIDQATKKTVEYRAPGTK